MDYATLFGRIKSATADEREAQAVVRMILDLGLGMSWADALCGRLNDLLSAAQTRLETIVRQVEEGVPVQYAVGRATFCGRLFAVRPGVLIPRPETEELCRWVQSAGATSILDIGTGSGCIAITLALDIPGSTVEAWDISPEALAVARENAERLGASVVFRQHDILEQAVNVAQKPCVTVPSPPRGDKRGVCLYDVIVSNPPYICLREQVDMEAHVLNHEPHEALFVPDDDPLLFYRAIARFAKETLKPSGKLYFEVNAQYAEDVRNLLIQHGYRQVTIREDSFGKPRFVRAAYL